MLHFVHHLLLRVERLLLKPKGFPNSLAELEGGLVVLHTFSNDKNNFSISQVLQWLQRYKKFAWISKSNCIAWYLMMNEMFLYGRKLCVFKHLILCSNLSTFKYNDSVDTNIYLQAHGVVCSVDMLWILCVDFR